ncbi:NADP-dependent oxidoreductase [Streptosporangium roseum]|uniref:Alcohol dehydrogenase GroES domain protein n=1 Tax=Streptosporangium roseum (strain ATCC 12428 / DSM 43021 / JCM 3005 / KCTC 9067 / NCIMB 10171 / NRRL 2505 / NI 9100) TaxID=479432 RepID=D2AUB1_STRRD|nr:NADP-dependent oxidoreductase [Streptosporangium roseum]ACZ90566.1 alcohol dehydrogenase GroES domain protein [Streptosporangium roseum DSM 43021]
MRAAAFSEFGGPEVLRAMEIETPEAGEGQVRVRVRAAGVQPFDLAVREGWTPAGVSGDLPRIPGNEFAGVVDQVGEGVRGISAGDEVLGFNLLNSYAEYVVVPAENVTAKPANMPWEVAGGFTAGTQTAYIALRQLGVGEGDTVLVHAAAGSVGTAAVQLARIWGATVIGTAREENHDYLRSLGATPVAYGEGLLERVRALAPGGVDMVLDGAGGEALDVSLQLVKGDRIVTLVEHGRAEELGVQLTKGVRLASRLAELAELYSDGRLTFPVRRTYPLDRAADAHREVETRHGRGKVVLTVG